MGVRGTIVLESGANSVLRIDSAILSGHSGGPVVIKYKDKVGRDAYAVVGTEAFFASVEAFCGIALA